MPTGRVGIPNAALLVLAGVVPVLIWRTTIGRAFPWLVGAVVVTQIVLIVWLMIRHAGVRDRAVLAVIGVAGVAAAILGPALPVRSAALAAAGACHTAGYGLLLTRFAVSLRPGREPLVTRFARRIRPTMPDRVVRYTRLVTIAWCAFFAAQLAVFAVLLLAASETVWSTFVTFWNLPLVAAMMLAEFGCRSVVFRQEPRTGMIATLAGLRHISFLAGKPP